MQDTQLEAYNTLKNINKKQNEVLTAVTESRGVALFDLVSILGWPVNRITGRLNELVKAGIIEDSGERKLNPQTKKRAIVWKLKERY